MNQEGSSLALQAVSRVKSANERLLQPRGREFLSSRSPQSSSPSAKGGKGSEKEREREREEERATEGVRRSSRLPRQFHAATARSALSCANLFN